MRFSLFLVYLFPILLCAQSPSGVVTYKQTTLLDSTCQNTYLSPQGLEMNIPDEVMKAATKEVVEVPMTSYLYFTARTTWAYSLLDTFAKGDLHATDFIRSYIDSSYKHLQLTDLLENEIGRQEYAEILTPTFDLRRFKRTGLEDYKRIDSTRTILGYTCQAYYHTENDQLYWIAEGINTPLMGYSGFFADARGLRGIVLGKESRNSKYEATAIKFCEISDAVLRHTPLLDLRPELIR